MRIKFVRPWRYVGEGEVKDFPDGMAHLLLERGFCVALPDGVESAVVEHEARRAVMPPRSEPKRVKA